MFHSTRRYIPFKFNKKILPLYTTVFLNMYHIRSNVSILCTLKKSMRVFRNEHFVSDLVYPGEQHLMYIVYKYVTSKQHKRTFSKYLFANTFGGEIKTI